MSSARSAWCAGLVALLGLGGALGCDSLRASANPDAPLWLHHPGGALSVLIRERISAETRQSGELYERGRPEIDVAHRRVFVGSSDRGLYAIRVEDGAILWRFETLGAVQCEPLYDADEDVVYFGSNDGALYKVRAADGKMLWRFATNAEVARRPVIHRGVLYVTNANDTIIAIEAASGRMKWHQHRTPAFGMEIAGYAGPAIGSDKVYTAFSDGVVMAYALDDGSEQWPAIDLAAEAEQATGDLPRYLDVDTTPILDHIASGDVVFVASYNGGVHALDAANGSRAWANDKVTGVNELVLWRQPAHASRERPDPEAIAAGIQTAGPMTPERHVLLASSGLSGLWALDPNDGRVLWHKALPEGGISAPVPMVGALLVTTTRYGIFLVSPLDGSVIDGIDTGGGYAMTPAAYGTRAFVLSNGGLFVELHVQPPPSIPARPSFLSAL